MQMTQNGHSKCCLHIVCLKGAALSLAEGKNRLPNYEQLETRQYASGVLGKESIHSAACRKTN